VISWITQSRIRRYAPGCIARKVVLATKRTRTSIDLCLRFSVCVDVISDFEELGERQHKSKTFCCVPSLNTLPKWLTNSSPSKLQAPSISSALREAICILAISCLITPLGKSVSCNSAKLKLTSYRACRNPPAPSQTRRGGRLQERRWSLPFYEQPWSGPPFQRAQGRESLPHG
jgi:hypothetical protein